MTRSRRLLRRGLTKVELVTLLLCVMVVGVLSSQIPRIRAGSGPAKHLSDAAQVRQVYQAWEIFARDFNGLYPKPGLVRRKPIGGQIIPGRGEEDRALNTTANLYSACVMQNYFPPELGVGVTEPNGRVSVKDDYDYEAYAPAQGVFWDDSFTADLQTGSNASYAHMPMTGMRGIKFWRSIGERGIAVVGNRGPRDGEPDSKSITLKIHEPHESWSGNICFHDGTVEFFTSMDPTGIDNLFMSGDGPKHGDSFLTFTKSLVGEQPAFQFD